MKQNGHTPVLLEETITGLGIRKDSLVLDGTADGGGHLDAILEKLGPEGKIIGLDWDSGMVRRLEETMAGERRVHLFHSNFSELEKVARSLPAAWRRPDAILFDLGLSSLQLYASGRGFSFEAEEGLEMTFDRARSPNAREFLHQVPESELAEILRTYGEEPFAGRIARAIVEARRREPIRTGKDLAAIIEKVARRRGRIHPATKTFQALRIYLNGEFENIRTGLEGAWRIVKPGGRIAVIAYHSGEDRIIKNFFKDKVRAEEGTLAFKKPLVPSRAEVLANPRSRSAKLRIIEKNK